MRFKRQWLFLVCGWLLVGLLLMQLHHYSAADYRALGGGPDLQQQLNWMSSSLRQGGGEATQLWYPEGYFFVHALYGLALVNQSLLNPNDAGLLQRNRDELKWVLTRLDSEPGRAPFPRGQAVEYGVFYQGWRNRLLGGLLLITPSAERDVALEQQFHRQSAVLAQAFSESPTHYLEAYPGQSWPVDNVVALTSLKLHDDLYQTHYQDIIDAWLVYTKSHLDPSTGLIPHHIDAATGELLQGSRGSSLVLALSFLPELDADFSRQQYTRYRELYAQPVLDFVLTREYPHGVDGPMDVDSGPLLGGIGPIASGVNLAAARANGDDEIFERTMQLAETVGVGLTIHNEKRYSFGLLLAGDGFLVWSKSLVLWQSGAVSVTVREYPRLTSPYYFWTNLLATLLVLIAALPLLPRYLLGKRINVMSMIKYSVFVLFYILLTACSAFPQATPTITPQAWKAHFAENRQKWEQQHISHYRFTLDANCFCDFALKREKMPLTIEVKDGMVISIRGKDGQPAPEFADDLEGLGTIEKLFDLLNIYLSEEAYKMNVGFDSEKGYPQFIDIDPEQQAMDDDLKVMVSEFTILQ